MCFTVSKKPKCQVYKTLIRPVLTYGCESWTVKKNDEQMLPTFERKVLRTIYGAVREGERWRKRYNFELKRDFGEPDIVTVVKVQRLRRAGHLMRMEENRAPLTLFRNNPEGRRGVGRPKINNRTEWINVLEQAKAHKWL